MNKLLLRLIAAFNPALEGMGVDTLQLHEILKVKLLIDSRRPNALMAGRRRTAANGKVASPWAVNFVLLLMGFFIGLVLTVFKMPLAGQAAYFSIFMVLMALTLISDFTTVLLDTRDQYIILPRPVTDRTMAVSRILHISIYVLRLALLQGLPGIIIAGFIDGIAASPVFLVQLIEATFLSILLVNIVYLLLMKSVTPEKFKEVISYFQIGFSVVIFGAYYLLPRLINVAALQEIDLLSHSWACFLPPVWIAALNEVLIHPGRANIITSLMAIAGLVVPVAGMWLVATVLAPGFNRRLAVAATSDDNTRSRPAITGRPVKTDFRDRLANLIAPRPLENAGFKITWKLAARLREFKIKVFPAFAYVPIYFLYFALSTKGSSLNDRFEQMRSGRLYVLLIYLCTFILSTFLMNVSYSEKFKAAWVYYASPVKQPGQILAGMYKAIVTLYFFPYCLAVAVVIIAIWGPQAINDVILAFLISLTYGILSALFMLKGLPFSKPVLIRQSGGRIITSLLILLFIGLAGFGHYFLMRWETVIWILIIPAAAVFWLMIYYYGKQTWDSIEIEEI